MLYTYLQFHHNTESASSPMGSVVIETENLTRTFGLQTAVSDLSLEVNAGEIFGFLGHNGAGKTTTVRLLNGLLSPTAGHARVLGLDPVTQGPALRGRTKPDSERLSSRAIRCNAGPSRPSQSSTMPSGLPASASPVKTS